MRYRTASKNISLFLSTVFFLLTGFEVSSQESPSKDSTYRISVRIENSQAHDRNYVLYSPEKWGLARAVVRGTGDTLTAGSTVPLLKRDLLTYKSAFSLEVPRDSFLVVDLELQGKYSITTPADTRWLYEPLETFFQKDRSRLWQQGIFLGVILIMGLYNLLIFLSVKDISYLFYTLSIFSLGVYFGFYYGFGIELFWPGNPVWDIYSYSVVIPFTNWARVRFTYHYFGNETLEATDRKILHILEWICLLTIGIHLFFYFAHIDFLKPIVTWIAVLGVCVLLVMLFYGLKGVQKGFIPAKFFVLANLAFVLGAILFIVRELGILPDNFLTRYVVQIGVLVQVVLFSLGLASRINQERAKTAQLQLQREIDRKELIESQKTELEEKVRQQTENLSKLNLLKTKILSIISHDLRNPIISIGSFLNLMIDHKDRLSKEEQTLMADKVRQSLQYLDQLLLNLLQWSRSQSNRLTPEFQAVDLRKIIENAIEYHALNIEIKHLQINRDLSREPFIKGDLEMLNFVFRNILGNAIKFSSLHGEIRIHIEESADRLTISICDFGAGMSQDKIEKLNTSVTMPTSVGTAKEKGSGLGLVICREFIQLHSGQLHIDSDGRSWTKVMVSLPRD